MFVYLGIYRVMIKYVWIFGISYKIGIIYRWLIYSVWRVRTDFLGFVLVFLEVGKIVVIWRLWFRLGEKYNEGSCDVLRWYFFWDLREVGFFNNF